MKFVRLLIIVVLIIAVHAGLGMAQVATKKVNPAVSTIDVNPKNVATDIGNTVQYTAVAKDKGKSNITLPITWNISNPAIGKISNKGLFTATGAGTAEVTASYEKVSGISKVIVNARAVKAIRVTPASASVDAGKQLAFTAEALDANNKVMPAAITWSVNNKNIGSIDTKGLFTSSTPGAVNITAASGTLSTTVPVTVTGAVLKSIIVSAQPDIIETDAAVQIQAAGRDIRGSVIPIADVKWRTDNAGIGVIDAKGVFKAVGPGKALITAEKGDVKGQMNISVVPGLRAIMVSPAALTTEVGKAVDFTAKGLDKTGGEVKLSVLKWTIDKPVIGSIDANGRFTATASGTTKLRIAARTVSSGNLVTSDAVTVTIKNRRRIKLTAPKEAVVAGEAVDLTAEVMDENGVTMGVNMVNLTWKSDPDLGQLNARGLKCVFQPTKTGTAKITATMGDVTSSPINMVIKSLDLRVVPNSSAVKIGGKTNFRIECMNVCPSEEWKKETVKWSVEGNQCYGGISQEGVATGIHGGSCTVKAKAGSFIIAPATVTFY
jgi:hypothetical protein